MMKRIVAALAGLFALALPSAALAQCSGIFTAGYFCGNSTATDGLAGAASPTAMFDRAFGGTNNSTIVRISGVWTVLASANSGVWITSAAGVPSISSTLPNAVQDNITRLGTIANVGAPIGATFGGTAQSSWAQGDILYASAVNTLAKLAAAATGNALISGTTPSWGKIALTTHVSGQLPLANGGCNGTTAATCLNNIMPTPTRAGDIAYWNGSAWVTVAGNNSGTNVLTENSSGVPSWAAPGTGTVTSINCNGGTTVITTSGTCASPEVLSSNRTYYVRVDGNDTNCTGVTDAAYVSGSYPQNCGFLTIQKGVDISYKTLDWAGYTVTVQVRDGTYTGATTITGKGIGQQTAFAIIGNTGTPNNVVISTTSADGFTISNQAVVSITGMKLQTTTGGNCVTNQNGGILTLGAVNYGASAGYHISSAYHAYTSITSQSYTISGAAVAHYYTTLNSVLLSISNTVTITGTPAWGTAFLVGAVNSYSHVVSTTFSGASTGLRFYMYMNAVYSDGSANSYSFLPGNAAGNGITQSGAVYNNDYEYNSWSPWTPTIATVSGTAATGSGQYKAHGKDLYVNVTVTVSSAGSAGTLNIPLPTANNYYSLASVGAAAFTRSLSCINTSIGTAAAVCGASITAGQTAIIIAPAGAAFATNTYAITGLIEMQ